MENSTKLSLQTPPTNQDSNWLWADLLRAIATCAVIVLHVSAPILTQYPTVAPTHWWIANCLGSVTRFCVPVFLMLSGALLLSKPFDLKTFLQKRMARILTPFLFWSLVYIGYLYWGKWQATGQFAIDKLFNFGLIKLQYGAAYHLWYIYMLIGLYLFFPILNKWTRNSSRKEVAYFVVLWMFALMLGMPWLAAYQTRLDLTYCSGYIGYPVLGYLLTTIEPNPLLKRPVFLLFLATLGLTVLGTYYLTLRHGHFDNTLHLFLSPNIVLMALGLFLWAQQLNLQKPWLIRLVRFISQYSFGIYLSHVLVLWLLAKAGLTWAWVHPALGIVVTSFLCLGLAAALTYWLRKIPIIGAVIAG